MELLSALSAADLAKWCVVDNSASEDNERALQVREAVVKLGGQYVPSPKNLGFGAGHNLALRSLTEAQPFHVMLNPDILLNPSVLTTLVREMENRPEVGLLMPKVLYTDGSFQPVCKLLPTPADFALRRFAPSVLKSLFKRKLAAYEMEGIENVECGCVPFLSGCFLLTRRSVLDRIGGFDERFFLYLEDVDLCRRMAAHSKLLYWPKASVTHICYRGAYRSTKLMSLFLKSAFAYFNKWGWWIDPARKRANRAALECLRSNHSDRNA